MARGNKNMMNKKNQLPVSKEVFRPVVKSDAWCSFKKRNEGSKAPYGYVVAVSKEKEFNSLPKEMSSGYIVRSKLIGKTFYVQFIPKTSFCGPEPNYTIHSFQEEITNRKNRRIITVLNQSRPKRVKRHKRNR